MKDIKVFQSDRSTPNNPAFSGGIVTWEFGLVLKRYLRIEFHDNGTLKDLTGSLVDTLQPHKVITYRLIREPLEMHMKLTNKFPTQSYFYHRRR